MNRRNFLKYLSAGATGLTLSGLSTTCIQSKKQRPNVLFIAIDDMNDWTTLFNSSNPIKTPNLVRLAKCGMFFSRAYCAAPACCPSRAAVMTGLRPTTSGVYGNRDPWEWQNLAGMSEYSDILQEHRQWLPTKEK